MSEPKDGEASRIEDLEVMVAHQARIIEELSEELTRAFRMIERLQHLGQALGERLGAVEEVALPKPEATKPPHY
ncbi:SlyX family protein [Jiella sp. MQZ9-1]|uniref:SlyX family protein n=1 Tax=Jiella flava TaxID=2816857 RepID=A0A939FXF6_9HYPH|nr:SlyX family protein [Jiella flava]MBO0661991.1 SlyX family protein [Jiella flava]MCD2470682.1 SlyX family protein [Jiella flava]